MSRAEPKTSARPKNLESNPHLSRWLRIGRDGTVSVTCGKVELGQGILTALAQIAAEELDVSLGRIRMLPASTAYSPDEGVTSGSLSIQDSGAALRHACAAARALLLERASERLGVPLAALKVEDGTVRGNGKSTTYWECADDALFDCEISAPALKSPDEFRVVGAKAERLDLPDKIAGWPRFVQDMALPGMLFGRVVRPPRRFVRLEALDQAKAKSMPGVVAVVRDGSFVGVLAEREETAIAAAKAIRDGSRWEWAPPPPDDHSWLRQHAVEDRLLSEKSDPSAKRAGTRTVEATYTRPYVAHASIGPSCAVAQLRGDMLEVWSHTQGIYNLRRELALVLGIPEEKIVVHHVEGAGCYGHNGADDVALDAALLARAAGGRPVKLQWMREDEFAWEPYGPAMLMSLRAELDPGGRIVDWQYEFWSNGHTHRPGRAAKPVLTAAAHLAQPFELAPAIDPPLPAGGAQRNAIPLYDFPNQRVVNHYVEYMPVRVSSLRSLGACGNVFAIESFIDELARAAAIDPVEFRLRHLKDERARAVIETAAARANWRAWKPSEGRGRGIGFAKYKNLGAYCAVVAEVEVEREVRVRRLVAAVDVGLAINPDGVVNQIEGGAIQATSWTLKEAVRFDLGDAGLNWETYPILKFSEVPAVEVVIVDRPDLPPVGAGECAQGPTTAAIANAVHDALGVRVRDLPLTSERIVEAINRA